MELSIVLPAYLEAESLESLLPAIKRSATAMTPLHEIIVVDAQQPMDDTPGLCQRHGVVHVHRTGGNTFGDAVRTGIEAARGEFILFMDADGSHNPACLTTLWAHRHEVEIVIGSRYAEGGQTENPAILIFMSWVVNVVFRICFGLTVRDVTNSLRLYRSGPLKSLRLQSNNFDIIEEILIKLCSRRHRARVLEVPIVFERRKAGESKRKLIEFAATYLVTLTQLMVIKFTAKD